MLNITKNPIILANGPPKSGKDYMEKLLEPHFNIVRVALITPVKQATMAAYGLTDAGMTLEEMERKKDEPMAVFKNKTFRQTVIRTAETYRAMYGWAHWAETLVRNIRTFDMEMRKRSVGNTVILVSDVGFPGEVDVLEQAFPDRAVLGRCHRYNASFGKFLGYEEAYGENTGKDSRNWVFSKRLPSFDWTNEGTDPEANVYDLIQHLKPVMGPKHFAAIAVDRGSKFLLASQWGKDFKVPQTKKIEPFANPTQYWPDIKLSDGPKADPMELRPAAASI